MKIFKDMDEALYNISKELLVAKAYSPRGQTTKELLKYCFVLEDAKKSIIKNSARKFRKKYIGAEMLWYVSGDNRASTIAPFAKIWDVVKNVDETVNSAYGKIVLFDRMKNYDGTQWDWAKNQLLKDQDTSQALINYNQPNHKFENNKDFVCTISNQFLLRDNKLHLITNMRSQDAIFGLGPDICWFAYLQDKMVNELKEKYQDLKPGNYYHDCGSLHVYERHFKMLENIVKTYEENKVFSEDMSFEKKDWEKWKKGGL